MQPRCRCKYASFFTYLAATISSILLILSTIQNIYIYMYVHENQRKAPILKKTLHILTALPYVPWYEGSARENPFPSYSILFHPRPLSYLHACIDSPFPYPSINKIVNRAFIHITHTHSPLVSRSKQNMQNESKEVPTYLPTTRAYY